MFQVTVNYFPLILASVGVFEETLSHVEWFVQTDKGYAGMGKHNQFFFNHSVFNKNR